MAVLSEAALDALVGAALRGRTRQVDTILAMHPGAAARDVHASAVLLDAEGLALLLEGDGELARSVGPRGLTPLALACTSRLPDDGRAAATARVLLGHGADPHDGRAPFAALEGDRRALLEVLVNAGVDPTNSEHPRGSSLLHWSLDVCWRPDLVAWLLERGADPNARHGQFEETLLHVAVRRRRLDAVELLLDRGADIDARTAGGDSAWRHATRRGFAEIAQRLADRGADVTTTPVDALALALLAADLDGAARVIAQHPDVVAGMGAEEQRLLADLAGRGDLDAVRFLLDHGAASEARGLDGGTPLQQCGWFAQPAVARLLIERGADVRATGCDHRSTPLGWAVHGSRYSGGAAGNQDRYVEVVDLLLDAGATVDLPGDPPDAPGQRMWEDATESVRARLLARAFPDGPPA